MKNSLASVKGMQATSHAIRAVVEKVTKALDTRKIGVGVYLRQYLNKYSSGQTL